jgi:hypothetical protein
VVLEKLHLALVLYGSSPGIKSTQITALARGGIALAGIKAKFARFKLPDHV